MLSFVARSLLVVLAAVALAGCTQVVQDLKAARSPHSQALHEQLSLAIHQAGFSHGIRSVREDTREIDSVYVAVPLDSLKRQVVGLHQMLFNVARLCARPEYANLGIEIELNAKDEQDREYMRGIVAPIVADARNVAVVPQRESTSELVITVVNDTAKRKP